MNNIDKLKELNITFNNIDEQSALKIMQEEYSYYQLTKYSILFEKYQKGEMLGKFVHLDFAQLYYLAEIDMHFSRIIMSMYLKMESRIKNLFLYHAEKYCNTQLLLNEYYESEREYLDSTYKAENNDIIQEMNIKSGIDKLPLSEFVDVVQFGTLERLIHHFYKNYARVIYNSDSAPFERNLDAVRRIRNIVAHNNSLIARLKIPTDKKMCILPLF